MKNNKRRTKIDCHIHTKGSDGWGTAEEIVANAILSGLDGIVITDHHKTMTAEGLKVAEMARSKGLRVFRGCEYSTAQGHLLIFGMDVGELHLGYYPEMQKVIDEVNKAGGVAVPAHPYQGYRKSLKDGVKKLSGVRAYETANGQCSYRNPDCNAKAVAAAKAKGKLSLGGSDSHDPRGVGLTYTVFHGNIKTEKDFIAALKRGQFRAVTDKSRVAKRLALDSTRYSVQSSVNAERTSVWSRHSEEKAGTNPCSCGPCYRVN